MSQKRALNADRDRLIEDLRIRAEKAEAESESRRQMLTEKAAALREEWIRAEKAEAALQSLTGAWGLSASGETRRTASPSICARSVTHLNIIGGGTPSGNLRQG